MAVKTLYFKNAIVNGAMSLQDGGTPPVGATSGTGWTVGKDTAPNFARMVAGVKSASTVFAATDALTPPAFSAASCWRSEQAFTGTFVNGTWSLAYRVRAAQGTSSQAGRVNCRIWKSANADGTGAVQLTSAVLVGSTTPAIPMSPPVTSTVTWVPGAAVAFNNEYLFVQCEWEITTVSANANSDVVFYVDVTGAITTPDFAMVLAPSLYNDIAETFFAPSPIILVDGVVPSLLSDADVFAVANISAQTTLIAALYSDTAETFFVPSPIITVNGIDARLYEDIDTILSVSVGSQETIYAPHYQDLDNTLGPDEVSLNSLWPALAKDIDRFSTPQITGGKQKQRLNGTIGSPGYMVGNMAGSHRSMSGSTHVEYGKVA